ncbi:MAG: GNAT family N-acetyltransferase [Rhodobacteraceae bacterium]|nr:GNAT family N-acetyltransferase [Paracoccaceae bacterium]
MTMPTTRQMAEAVWATWPGEAAIPGGAFDLRRSSDDSRRSRAATSNRTATDAEIAEAADTMQSWGQPAMFWVPGDAPAFEAQLDGLGYAGHDSSYYYGAPVGPMAERVPPRIATFEIWEPLAIMADIFTATGTSLSRQEVMARAQCPKTAILGRVGDDPAGVTYVGAHEGIAMVHAVGVLPQHRRQGLAAHMMAQAAIWAERNGCAWVGLAVGAENHGARALYASLGMAPVGSYQYRSLPEPS